MSLPERAVSIRCGSDRLVGILHEPTQTARIGILVVVGGPQYRIGSHRQFVQMARWFAREGYAVMRFDCRGMGDSEGVHPGFEQLDPDIEAAIMTLRVEVPTLERVVGLGLCDAASALLLYCASHSGVDGLVLINAWARTELSQAKAQIKHYYSSRLIQWSFWTKLFSGGINLKSTMREYCRDLMSAFGRMTVAGKPSASGSFLQRMEAGAASFRGEMLVLTSEFDLTAREFELECRRSQTWREVLSRREVRVVSIPNADHTFSAADSLNRACTSIVTWIRELEQRSTLVPH
jgi:exosortase A-associated hydrolase 1